MQFCGVQGNDYRPFDTVTFSGFFIHAARLSKLFYSSKKVEYLKLFTLHRCVVSSDRFSMNNLLHLMITQKKGKENWLKFFSTSWFKVNVKVSRECSLFILVLRICDYGNRKGTSHVFHITRRFVFIWTSMKVLELTTAAFPLQIVVYCAPYSDEKVYLRYHWRHRYLERKYAIRREIGKLVHVHVIKINNASLKRCFPAIYWLIVW